MVLHAQLPHFLDVVKIPAVHDHRLPERAFYALEIRMTVLVPVGNDYQSVRTSERLIISLSIIYSVAEQTPRILDRGGVMGTDRNTLPQQTFNQGQRWRVSHIVRPSLEGEPPHRDAT